MSGPFGAAIGGTRVRTRATRPSVLAMRIYLAVAVLLALIAAPEAAAADEQAPANEVRSAKRFLVGVSPAEAISETGSFETTVLSSLRFSLQITPRFGLDLCAGRMPFDDEQDVSDILFGHLGARLFLSDEPGAPYLFARAGVLQIDWSDGSSDEYAPFAAAGGGLEYTHASGLSVWAELGLAASARAAIYSNVGVGFRFGGLDG